MIPDYYEDVDTFSLDDQQCLECGEFVEDIGVCDYCEHYTLYGFELSVRDADEEAA